MRDFHRAFDRTPLGPIMAPALAMALAFACFAMPEWRLAQAADASGLSAVLPWARPPLGDTARGLAMLVAASLGGGAVWALFAWLERPRRKSPAAAIFDDAPTLRRADAHPDAPARRPIFATADLGAPLDAAPAPVWDDLPPIAADELLLDSPVVEPLAPLAPAPPPITASDLLDRLESGLRRRGGGAPEPDAALRDAFLRLQSARG